MDFKDKVVLVTGASSGIGESIALLFAEKSAKVILVGRRADELQRVAAGCGERGGREPLVVVADLTDEGDVRRVYDTVVGEVGKLDVLINNAGAAFECGILKPSLEAYDRTLDINLRAVYHLTATFAPLLIESKGCVVNISSVASTLTRVGNLAYAVAKAGLDHLTRTAALELAPKGVRVNAVNPGVTRTKIFEKMGLDAEECASFMERAARYIPLGRVVAPDEVARAVLFLASAQASAIIGATLVVDAGYSLKGAMQYRE